MFTCCANKPKSAIVFRKPAETTLKINTFSTNNIIFSFIKFNNERVLTISAYFSPFSDIESDLRLIQTAIDSLKPNYYIIGVDSNSHSRVWFDRRDDKRGQQILNFISENNLIILNTNENSPTFDSHQGNSSIDLTIINNNFANFVHNWTLLEVDSQSDHKYIYFEIADQLPNIEFKTTYKYNTKSVN